MPKITALLVLSVSVLALAAAGGAQQPAAEPLAAVKIKDNLYWLKGGVMANAGFYVGDKGVTVIDAKMTPEGAKAMIDAIAGITPQPVQTVILTHSDGDHVNGLAAFPKGLRIVASENCAKEMAEAFKDEKMAALRSYLPTLTFKDRLEIAGLPAKLYSFGPAHTSGDIVIFFPKEKAAFIGDLAFLGRDPLVHRQKGGTSFGLVRNLGEILKLDADVFVVGHNDPLTKSDIAGLKKSIEEKQAKVKDMIAAGKSLEEIKKAFGIEETAAPGGRRWPSLIEVIYLDITEKRL